MVDAYLQNDPQFQERFLFDVMRYFGVKEEVVWKTRREMEGRRKDLEEGGWFSEKFQEEMKRKVGGSLLWKEEEDIGEREEGGKRDGKEKEEGEKKEGGRREGEGEGDRREVGGREEEGKREGGGKEEEKERRKEVGGRREDDERKEEGVRTININKS